MTTTLLTDDEMVALSVGRGQPWPIALPTVPMGSQTGLRASANRGLRSLAVRDLVDACAAGQPGVGVAIDDLLRATRLSAVTASPAARPDVVVGGGLVFAAPLGAAEWVCDTFTANGVHSLDRCTAEEAVSRAVALAERAFGDGVVDLAGAVELGLAMSQQGKPSRRAVITRGQLAVMEAVPGDGPDFFEAISTHTSMDQGLIAEILGIA